MEENAGYLGVDVSKGYADFLLIDSNRRILERSFQLDDNRTGHTILAGKLKDFIESHQLTVLYAGLESTGGYENNWFQLLKNLGNELSLKTSRLNPFPVKAHRDARRTRNVTDAISAEAIASYLLAHAQDVSYNDPVHDVLPSMRRVYKLIKMLQKQTTQLLNQLEKLIYVAFPELLQYCKRSFPRWLLRLMGRYPTAAKLAKARINGMMKVPFLDEQRAKELREKARSSVASQEDPVIEELIRSTVEEIIRRKELIKRQKTLLLDIAAPEEIRLLKSIKGIGPFSAACLLIEIEDVSRFKSAKKLASFFGLHPVYKVSGDGKSAFRMSKQGRSAPRGILYMCALSAIGFDPHLKRIYARHRARGKNHHQAIGAIMHKMLRIIYGVLKSGKPYDPDIDRRNIRKSVPKGKAGANENKVRRYQQLNLEAPISHRNSKARKSLLVDTASPHVDRNPEES